MPPDDTGPPESSSGETLRDAYARACERMARDAPTAPGYRLFWVGGRSTGWMDLPAGGAYAIVGRHSECDAVLADDASISLRHLLAMTVALSDGLALRLLDLQTALPFYLENGRPQRSIVACGPVAVSLGDYVVGGIPIEEQVSPGAFRLSAPELPISIVTEAAAVPRSVRPNPRSHDPDLHPSSSRRAGPPSRVTTLRPSVAVWDLPRRETKIAPRERPPSATRPCATLTLRRHGRAASVDLTEAELDVGVLVGRADRCYDAGLRAVLDKNVSRGHVLLLHHYDVFEAFDLCSTQGTFAAGERVRRFPLPDAGATLTLATLSPVTLEWQRRRP